ncbi:MAG: hypothetical protein AB1656_17425 [Candidatus Omnitrophota bacterium]
MFSEYQRREWERRYSHLSAFMAANAELTNSAAKDDCLASIAVIVSRKPISIQTGDR